MKRTNTLRQRMGNHRIPYRWVAEAHPALRARILTYWVHTHAHTLNHYHAWRIAVRHARAAASSSPWSASWYRAAICVHEHEGAWNDPNAPYWGGMQMDMSFQYAYGAAYVRQYGTADHWPVHDQLMAAYRAWTTRGWTPWPNTARMCGLL